MEAFTPHSACSKGVYTGSAFLACDESLDAKGAYAYELEYFSRVALHGINFSALLKKNAGTYAIALNNNNFLTPPSLPRPVIALTDAVDSHLVLFDGGRLEELFEVKITSQAVGFILAQDAPSIGISSAFMTAIPSTNGPLTYYSTSDFSELPSKNPGGLVGMYASPGIMRNFYLTGRSLTVQSATGSSQIALADGEDAERIENTLLCADPNEDSSAGYITYKSGRIDRLRMIKTTAGKISISLAKTSCFNLPNIKALTILNSQKLALSIDGKLSSSVSGSDFSPVEKVMGRTFLNLVFIVRPPALLDQ